MTTKTNTYESVKDAILAESKAARDSMSVKRVFGESYEVGSRTIIPVAAVSGGAGGGSGEGSDGSDVESDDTKTGQGFGSGFGLNARPVGVYEVSEEGVEWNPAVDVNRIVKGGQVLAGIMAVCITLAYLARQRR